MKKDTKQLIILLLVLAFFLIGFIRILIGKYHYTECVGYYNEYCY